MNEPPPTSRVPAAVSEEPPRSPLVWIVSGYRAGERTQMLALAQALGWRCEIKTLAHRAWDFVPGLLRLSSLAGIDLDESSDLKAPWPDVVITAGMRNEPVARWIRHHAGKRCRLVNIGRPWAGYHHFDLIVTTPQYRLPERHNILQNTGTLHLVSESILATASARWQPAFSHLPGPCIGLLVGGDSGPYTLGPRAAERLARHASRMAKDAGGSLLITTSSRTSRAATDALARGLDCPHYLHRWTPDQDHNPYLGVLALSHTLIVTSDSVSMLSEAVGTGKPVLIYDLEEADSDDFRWGALLYRFLMRFGHQRLTRDLDLFHRRLTESGRAAWLGDIPPSGPAGSTGDLERAVRRVQSLVIENESHYASVRSDSA